MYIYVPSACYRFRSDCSYSLVPASAGGAPLTPPLTPHLFSFLSQTEEPANAGTCACDRRALQQLALNMHVKHSDLTWPDLMFMFYCVLFQTKNDPTDDRIIVLIVRICKSKSEYDDYFKYTVIVFQSIILLFGVFMTFTTRKVLTNYKLQHETFSTLISVHNVDQSDCHSLLTSKPYSLTNILVSWLVCSGQGVEL